MSGPIIVGAILVGEGDLVISHVLDPVVRDSDAMSIAGQIFQDLLGTGHRTLGVDDPVFLVENVEQGIERAKE